MDRLVTVKEMKERYQCSNPTARRYLRKCVPHYENPLVAPEWAVKEWENSRLVTPVDVNHKRETRTKQHTGRTIVPRKR